MAHSAKKKYTEDAMRGDMKHSGQDLDAARRRNIAYEYLCHLEEARKWLEACLKCELPPASDMEQALRNGVILVKLARFFAPDVVSARHIFDEDEKIYHSKGLVFRHTDNSSQWIRAMKEKRFPEIFHPEVTDIYDKKNMPRVIYCIHALSRYLVHLGIAPEMQDLKGVAQFTEEEISAMDRALGEAGVQMPQFGKIGGVLAKEIGGDAAAMHAAVLKINQALEQRVPAEDLLKPLRTLAAGLESVEGEYRDGYRTQLLEQRDAKVAAAGPGDGGERDVYDTNLTRDEIQKGINVVNASGAAQRKEAAHAACLAAVNAAVDAGDADKLGAALADPAGGFAHVAPEASMQYLAELTTKKQATHKPLTQGQIQDGVDEANTLLDEQRKVDAAMAAINSSLAGADAGSLLTLLREHAKLLELPPLDGPADRYRDALAAAARRGPLTQKQIQDTIAAVNAQLEHERRLQEALTAVNAALDGSDPAATLAALRAPVLALKDVDEAGAAQYHTALAEAKRQAGPLGRDRIQEVVLACNFTAEENAKHAAAIFNVNEAVKRGDAANTLAALKDPYVRVQPVHDVCRDRYQAELAAALQRKEAAAGSSAANWTKATTEDGRAYYVNKLTNETQWQPPEAVADSLLKAADIQAAVDECNAAQARSDVLFANQDKIILLQALVRGFLVRQAFQSRLAFINGQSGAAVKLQSAFRGAKQRKAYKDRLDFLNAQVKAAVAIQAAWKGAKVRKQYKNLTKVTNPPVATVRKFLHLLDQSETDFGEEIAVQQMKEQVVREIKNNKQLENDVNDMDLKIALLVRNRIDMEDVVKQSKLLKRHRKGEERRASAAALLEHRNSGLKSLNKDAHARLISYQHLFYLLQTNPSYFASLVFIEQPLERWPTVQAHKFLAHVIQTVYNYASNAREQYLLLKLFRTALRKEVMEKIATAQEFITGNPTVVKLVINYHRGAGAGEYLQATLAPLVRRLLDAAEVDLSTDPVDVYHRWINQREAETGEKSDLPYDVDRDEALRHEPVRRTIDATVHQLLDLVGGFLSAIIGSLPHLPFGLRYISSCLRADLKEKFPSQPEEDVAKVLGNLLYYRYMNPAIVTPEGFDVIDVAMTSQITPTHRKNLAYIARVLQFAASGQRFDEDQGHMSAMNKFLVDAWAQFRTFFLDATKVESAEEHFNMDEYSDAVMVTKPVIYISPAEIHYTHEMLIANIATVAPDPADPLRVILADLGPLPEEETALGAEGTPQNAASKTETSLTLTNKFEVPESDETSTRALFARTKRMIIDVIRAQPGKNLLAILTTPATPEEEADHARRIAAVAAKEAETKPAPPPVDADGAAAAAEPEKTTEFQRTSSTAVKHPDGRPLTLAELKERILANAEVLEREGLCARSNNYQDLLNSIAQDIRNQRIYRRQRKQELAKLKTALADLGKKTKFYHDQADSYDVYVQSCMEQIAKSKGKKKGFLSRSKKPTAPAGGAAGTSYNFGTVKYNAARLKEKGVLLSVETVPDSKLKYVTIEIASTEVGHFVINANVVGVQMEQEEIDFQDLLQKQYENIQTMKMFDYCTVNVNLLIFLINKKFFNK